MTGGARRELRPCPEKGKEEEMENRAEGKRSRTVAVMVRDGGGSPCSRVRRRSHRPTGEKKISPLAFRWGRRSAARAGDGHGERHHSGFLSSSNVRVRGPGRVPFPPLTFCLLTAFWVSEDPVSLSIPPTRAPSVSDMGA